MSICKRCGCEFEYSMKNGTGYAPDLCGAFCDGVYSERKVSALKIAGLMTQIDELRDERDALAAELATIRRRWNHVAGLAQTMGLKMDGQNSWRFQPLYHGRGPTIEAAVDDAIERIEKARDA